MSYKHPSGAQKRKKKRDAEFLSAATDPKQQKLPFFKTIETPSTSTQEPKEDSPPALEESISGSDPIIKGNIIFSAAKKNPSFRECAPLLVHWDFASIIILINYSALFSLFQILNQIPMRIMKNQISKI